MPVIALQGIRGGCGVTSVTAALAWALAQSGEKVLAIDFSPANLLRLHFNMPYDSARGWATAVRAGEGWEQGAMRYHTQLDFLPFGQLPAIEQTQVYCDWQDNLTKIANTGVYDWVLLDTPVDQPALAAQALSIADHTFTLLHADSQSHVRLHQQAVPVESHYLVNQFMPGSQLQQDILLLWQQSLPRLLPVILHRDEAMAESIAAKRPVGEMAPQSKSCQELQALASWCQIHLRAGQK
ncbi:cellulose biosynthesis protein BcsQ [Ewingella americana]|uniref:cellulose biosynthesis protein BcsQ n=1 Tax=Ewingella americana TaxID=41202 RepID=UPI00163AABAF|nr:cellulose biosynthesis protein BcsQ [Ewingella americana]QMV51736.1 cellulose synthase operon protein YhjQ [Ewingella americana]